MNANREDSPKLQAPPVRAGRINELWRGAKGKTVIDGVAPYRAKISRWDDTSAIGDIFSSMILNLFNVTQKIAYPPKDGSGHAFLATNDQYPLSSQSGQSKVH